MYNASPITVAGQGTGMNVDVSSFYFFERGIMDAQYMLRTDPDQANVILEQIANEARRFYAIGRKDDADLPSHYRAYLPK
jgi:hypothetical protein